MVGIRYLSSAQLQGFNKYKYCAKETSPLAVYVVLPTWNKLLKLVPLWVAPNLLTLVGWLLVMLNFWLLAYYDWDYNTSTSDRVFNRPPIPAAIWIFCGVSHFLAYCLDGLDGKQARRTNSSSPLGELFDHGCDSWGAILLPLSLISAIGRGSEWGGSTHHAFVPCLSTLAGFYYCHWEKYITGCLYLPWIYDVMQIGCGLAYLATGVYGVELWHFYVFPGWNVAFAVKWILILGFFGSLPTGAWNLYEFYTADTSSSEESQQTPGSPTTTNHGRRLGVWPALSPWLPFVIFAILYAVWVKLSVTDIIEREPRILLFSMGIIFSNIACRLIIAQMSGLPAELFNLLLIPLAIAVAVAVLLPRYELYTLYVYSGFILVAHLHYAISIVEELCEHFRIYAFSLAKRELDSQH